MAWKIALLKNYAYVVLNGDDGLQIIDLNCTSSDTTPSSTKWIILGTTLGGGVLALGSIITYIVIKRIKSASSENERKPLVVSS